MHGTCNNLENYLKRSVNFWPVVNDCDQRLFNSSDITAHLTLRDVVSVDEMNVCMHRILVFTCLKKHVYLTEPSPKNLKTEESEDSASIQH